jgi:hypothetical protein
MDSIKSKISHINNRMRPVISAPQKRKTDTQFRTTPRGIVAPERIERPTTGTLERQVDLNCCRRRWFIGGGAVVLLLVYLNQK